MNSIRKETDVILIGAGIMSATLGSMLKELEPSWQIKVFEKLKESRGGKLKRVEQRWNGAFGIM